MWSRFCMVKKTNKIDIMNNINTFIQDCIKNAKAVNWWVVLGGLVAITIVAIVL